VTSLIRSRPRPPVRALHLGLGNFFRAHQAWYTHAASDGADWGIAAFTGRSANAADVLAGQDALYLLDVRDDGGDCFDVVESLATVHHATDGEAWTRYWADPTVSHITLTVTEAGYRRDALGALDERDPEIHSDIAALQDETAARTAPGRIVAGLMARRSADGGPIALIPCDNLPANGAALARVVRDLAERVDPTLLAWIEESATFVSTMVDRITPATTEADRVRIHLATGVDDRSPVITEPFSDWVLAPPTELTVPRWETAGATWVDDAAPYEARKLLLLNGAHSLLAYTGQLRGHRTVADAIADDTCRAWVEQWWGEARAYVPLPDSAFDHYSQALLNRWDNRAIEHRLAQIAMDGSQKLVVRIVPVIRAERRAGRLPTAACRALAAWVLSLRAAGGPASDPRVIELVALADGDLRTAVPRTLRALDPTLPDDHELVAAVVALAEELDTTTTNQRIEHQP
jgi:fructuronate reductase